MIATGYRIAKLAYADNPFDGEGARVYGGRWNNKGTSVVYLAGSLSLAALELLVHLESEQILSGYISISVEFDAKLAHVLPDQNYPEDWLGYPAPTSTKAIGDAWFQRKGSLLLKVRSSVIPGEHNYLLNPLHPDFSQLTIGHSIPFIFDSRLVK